MKLAGVVALLALGLIACGEPPRPRNAILIVLDTLRADGLSAYGNPRETSPAIDRLAREGVLFEKVVTNATWTLPATVGLLSGRYPTQQVFDRTLRVSLVETLRDAGFATAAFSEGGWVGARFGLDRGFGKFEENFRAEPWKHEQARVAGRARDESAAGETEDITWVETTFATARAWLEGVEDRPFFLMIHTYEAHTPYLRQRFARGLDRGALPDPVFGVSLAGLARVGRFVPGPAELAYIRALYDGGVAAVDGEVGALLGTLDELGLSEETLVVVTSDHGEQLGLRAPPRPGSHGDELYDELALVPLVVRDPTRTPTVRRVTAQVRTIDTLPTILDLLGFEPVPGIEGRTLSPFMLGEETEHRPAWSRVLPHESFGYQGSFALRNGAHKLIVNHLLPLGVSRDIIELYDLERDPGEMTNVASSQPETRDAMLEEVKAIRAAVDARGVPDFDLQDAPGEHLTQLRALGYVFEPSEAPAGGSAQVGERDRADEGPEPAVEERPQGEPPRSR